MIDSNTIIQSNTVFPFLKVKSDKVIAKCNKGTVTIPSKAYPIHNQRNIKLFNALNTIDLTSNEAYTFATNKEIDEIKHIFNNSQIYVGKCYSSIQSIFDYIKDNNYEYILEDIKSYVGWVFVGDTLPLHHCWLVYKDRFILDSTLDILRLVGTKLNTLSLEQQRIKIANVCKALGQFNNSYKFTFGKCANYMIYVGSECSPKMGINQFTQLRKKYPSHLSYKEDGMNQNGASKLQSLIY